MPVTIKPTPHPAEACNFRYKPAKSAKELFKGSCYNEHNQCRDLIDSSFSDINRLTNIYSSENGFIWAAVQAYNCHHRLIIRPDDIWIVILTQFSIYVNKNAEEVRHIFVRHEGKKDLEVVLNRQNEPLATFPEKMTVLLQQHLVDQDLRTWILPDFTTTTENDTVASSMIMMATLQKYFKFSLRECCGIPSVTLEGQKRDWEKILSRVDKLPSFGKETAQWSSLLTPVLKRFVHSFEAPDSAETIDFWQKIIHHFNNFSGPSYYSGWITAFCFWDENGSSMYPLNCTSVVPPGLVVRGGETVGLVLDGVWYHMIESHNVPAGFASVPVKVSEIVADIPRNMREYDALAVAGLVGIKVSSSGEKLSSGKPGLDTLEPVVGWWFSEKK